MHARISRSHRQLAIGTLALAAISTISGLAFAGHEDRRVALLLGVLERDLVSATPASVKPGKKVTITASKFGGDRSVTIKLSGAGSDSSVRQVSGGTVTFTVTPRKVGSYTVTVTGQQSGAVAKDTFQVKK